MLGTTLITIRERDGGSNDSNASLSFNHEDEYEITIRNPFSEQEEQHLEWYFEEHFRFPFLEQIKAQQAAGSITIYGEELFKQIFGDHDAYAAYKAALQNGINSLHFEIAGSPKFHELHWEALKDPKLPKPFSLEAPMVRKNLVPQTVFAAARPSPTVNLLIVTARPHGGRDVGYRTISRPLVEGLHRAEVPVEIDLLRPGTYKTLVNHLDETRAKHGVGHYHVIHFDVHGALLTFPELVLQRCRARYGRPDIKEYQGLKAFLFLEGDKAGEADLVVAGELAALLLTHQTPITILNACQSGKQVGAAETSLGSRLMQAGVQMVLAMGYSVTVSATELMMSILYEQLFAGQQMSEAIRRGRLELYHRKGRRAYFNQTIDLEDWLLPVTYQNQEVRLSLRPFAPEEEERYYSKQAARYQPPQPACGFVGRDLDILQIEKRLLAVRNVLLLSGMGGAGKTTLLNHLGSWWQTTGFVDQVFYFGYDEKAYTLQQVLHQIAAQLLTPVEQTQFQAKSLAAQQAMLAQRLCSHRHLLILDNLESVTGSRLAIPNTLSAQEQNKLKAFLADLVEGKTLVLLGSRGNEEWLAKETFGDNVYDLPGLDAEAASTLADRILAKHQIPLQRTDETGNTRDLRDEADFKDLLKLLDGYPLALEVVLANLTRQTPSQVLQALQAGDVALDRGDTQKKTESILRCIDYSYSNIAPESQALLFCLFPFTSVICIGLNMLEKYVEQLKQQPALAHLQFERFDEVLKEAANWGLLNPHSEVSGFLRLQPIFPYFLRSRVEMAAYAEMRQAVEMAFRQHYEYWGEFMVSLLLSKMAKDKQLGQLLVRFEYENLVTALRLGLKEQSSILKIYATLKNYLDMIEGHQQGLELGEMVLAALEKYESEKLAGKLGLEFAGVINDIGGRQLGLNQFAAAEKSQKKALSLIQASKIEAAKKLQASVLHNLGNVAEARRQWMQAEQYYQKSLANDIEFNNRYPQAKTYHHLGIVAQKQRQWQKAEQYYQKSLAIKIEFNERFEQAMTYYQLGYVAREQRQWLQAEQYYQKALELFIEFNDRHNQALVYHQLGMTAQTQRQWSLAEQYYRKTLEIKIEFNDRYSQAYTYHNLGVVVEEQRQLLQAKQYYQKALEFYEEFNDRYAQASTYRQLGVVAHAQRQWSQAEQCYRKALEIQIEFNDRYEQAGTYHNLGVVSQEQGQWQQAEQYYQKALEIFVEFNDRHNQALVYHQLGRIPQEQRQWQQAEQYYQKALEINIEFNDRYEQAKTYNNLGMIAQEQQQWQQAREYFLKTLEISVEFHDAHNVQIAIRNLARLWQASGDTSLPGAVAVVLKIQPQEAEALLQKLLEEGE